MYKAPNLVPCEESSLTKEQLLEKLNKLEDQALRFSRTDWHEYEKVTEQIKNINMILLDKYDQEGIAWLNKQSTPA